MAENRGSDEAHGLVRMYNQTMFHLGPIAMPISLNWIILGLLVEYMGLYNCPTQV